MVRGVCEEIGDHQPGRYEENWARQYSAIGNAPKLRGATGCLLGGTDSLPLPSVL